MQSRELKVNEVERQAEQMPLLGTLRLDFVKESVDAREIKLPEGAECGKMTVELERKHGFPARLEYQLNVDSLEGLREALTSLRDQGRFDVDKGLNEPPGVHRLKEDLFSLLEWQTSLSLLRAMNEEGERIEGQEVDMRSALKDVGKGLRDRLDTLSGLISNQREGLEFLSSLLRSGREELTAIALVLMSPSMVGSLQQDLVATCGNSSLQWRIRQYCHGLLLPEARARLRRERQKREKRKDGGR